jgi:hypothetical protein
MAMDGGVVEEVGVAEGVEIVSVDESEHPAEIRNAPSRIISRIPPITGFFINPCSFFTTLM